MAVYTKNPVLRFAKRARNAARVREMSALSRGSVSEGKVLFMSFGGRQYSDNPRAISQMLHAIAPDVKQVWLFDDPGMFEGTVPYYVVAKRNEGGVLKRELATSRAWVSNFQLPPWTVKRDDQLYVQTYHGDRAFKKVLYDCTPVRDFKLVEAGQCDLMLAGSAFGERMLRSAFKYRGAVLRCGSPRNDKLVDDSYDRSAVRTALGIPADCRVLLYAPTFRDGARGVQPNYGIDLGEVMDALAAKTGEKWVCLTRKHPSSKGLSVDYSDTRIGDASEYPYSDDLLAITDFLISDYSSIINDYVLRRKPAVLYIPDIEEYCAARPLAVDIEEVPFLKARSQGELLGIIENHDALRFAENCDAVLGFYGAYETGCASRETAGIIADFMGCGSIEEALRGRAVGWA